VRLPESEEDTVIVFSKGYHEPEEDTVKGKKKEKKSKWVAFLFNAQVFCTMASFLRYNLLNFLNEKENTGTIGDLFRDIVDESGIITYGQRLWEFFRGLFNVAFRQIFSLFKIEEHCSSYINALTQALCASTPFHGCET
jgi:hypothetical protein